MNRRALYYALTYSALVICFKVIIVLGGYSLSRFGYYFSGITAVFFIIPFYVLAIRGVRDKEYGGVIAGREAMRITLTIFAVAALITSVYHYIEFEWVGKELAIEYYQSQQFIDFLKTQQKIQPEAYPRIIAEQIVSADNAAFKATTGKLFSFMIVGLSAAFITSAVMKRRASRTV